MGLATESVEGNAVDRIIAGDRALFPANGIVCLLQDASKKRSQTFELEGHAGILAWTQVRGDYPHFKHLGSLQQGDLIAGNRHRSTILPVGAADPWRLAKLGQLLVVCAQPYIGVV